jgi:multimeric flavodoxin WrbA
MPTYLFQVSAIMKIFLGRLGFAFHRPHYLLGKTFTSIVVQAFYGGLKAVEYLGFVGDALGFNVVKGGCLNSLEPMTHKQQRTTALLRHTARGSATGRRGHHLPLRRSCTS